MMAQHLMQLGDEATGKLGGITRAVRQQQREAEAPRRGARPRGRIGAQRHRGPARRPAARRSRRRAALSEQLRVDRQRIGRKGRAASASRSASSADRTREADQLIAEATDRLAARLAEIEVAGTRPRRRASAKPKRASRACSTRCSTARRRRWTKSAPASTSSRRRSPRWSSRPRRESARPARKPPESLAPTSTMPTSSLGRCRTRVAEQDRASQRMIAEIDRGLALIDERFSELAANGDERANRFLESLTRARTELDTLAAQAGVAGHRHRLARRTHRGAARKHRTADRRDPRQPRHRDRRSSGRRRPTGRGRRAARPEVDWIRDAAVEAGERLSATGATHRRAAGPVRRASRQRRRRGRRCPVEADRARVDARPGRTRGGRPQRARPAPALVASLVQVKEAAAHAAERAREAIEAVIPESAGKLSEETRAALERVIRESIEDRLREVETVAARAVESARAASDRLTQQMLTLGQSAAALEQHIEQTHKEQREKDSEAFARRVSLLIDSMHSAAIDVGKILSDEIDDKAWDAYLKGNRGVFTSRAVRLIGGSETRAHPRPLRERPRVPALGQPLRPRFRGDAPPGHGRARRRDHRGDLDVVGHGQALRRARPGDRQAALAG